MTEDSVVVDSDGTIDKEEVTGNVLKEAVKNVSADVHMSKAVNINNLI